MPRLGSGIPLQARAAEMERLRAAFARADSGRAVAVLLSGDAGLGKSRLAQELAGYAAGRGATVLTGHCLEAGDVELPYLPFVEALGDLPDPDRALLSERPVLRRLVGGGHGLPDRAPDAREPDRPSPSRPAGAGDEGQLRIFDAAWGLLTELAETRPVVLVLEDLHWADVSSRHLLSFLVGRMRSQRLLLVASYRSDDLHRRHPLRPVLAELARRDAVERLDLAPLARRETERLVAALAEEELPDGVVARVARRAEGNPFFAEELLASCVDCDPADAELPPALADVLLARVEARSTRARQVIRLASVGGRRVPHARLQAVTADSVPPGELDEALREAVAHHLLVVEGEHYSFRHALLREAVYDDLLPGERARMHQRYAECIAAESGNGVAAALAHHSRAGHDLPRALAAHVAASREAARLGAPAEALHHAEAALELWATVPESSRPADTDELGLLRNASSLAQRAGEPERSVSYARAAVRRADADGDPEQAAHARWRLGQALSALEDPDGDATEVIERAWQLVAEQPPSRTKAWVEAVYANRLRRDDRAAARELAERARDESRGLGLPGPEAEALTTLALIDDREGRAESARRHIAEAIERASGSDSRNAELRARHFLALRHYELGELTQALRATEDGVARAEATGMTWSAFGVELRVLRVLARYAVGEWQAAEAAASQPGGRVSDTVRLRLSSAYLYLLVGRGEFDAAERTYERLEPEWGRDTQIAHFAGCAGVELAAWRGDAGLARRRADTVLEWWHTHRLSQQFGIIRLNALALHAHAGSGEPRRGELDRLLATAEEIVASGTARTGEPGPEAYAWLAMARAEHGNALGEPDPDAWLAAVKAFDYGDVYRAAIAWLRHAEALLAAGEREQAGSSLAEALPVARRLGAVPLLGAITALARRGRLPLDGSPVAVPDVLTPRELGVLELVARGHTNREVGARLYISEKTVSVHLSRAMAKLGVARRAEAVAAAYERGLL